MLNTEFTAFLVRRAIAADVAKMLPVWQETAETLARTDARYQLAADAGESWQQAMTNWIEQEDKIAFLAERHGRVIGYIQGMISPNSPGFLPVRIGCISDLVIDSHGMTGSGRALLEALRGWFTEQGITRLETRVPARNAIAQAFWRALGATELYEVMLVK